MDEVIPKHPSTIRKSAFGRTSLFIPSSDVLLREIQCMGGVSRHENASVYHMHEVGNKKVACWHCCETFEGSPLQIPRLYDPVEKVYHVYGNFCSANCGKAYIIENSTYDRGQHLNVFVRMLREVYGIKKKVVEAPPRISLDKFGGPFNIKTFRTMENICNICQPPFVSYCMVVQERSGFAAADNHELFKGSSVLQKNEDEDISNIPSVPMYESFLENKKNGSNEDVSDNSVKKEPSQPCVIARKKKRKEKESSTTTGVNTLANY